MHRRAKSSGGFTLIELLVVIAVIGLLASIVLASLTTTRRKARDSRRISDVRQIRHALELYFDDAKCTNPDHACYPAALSELVGSYLPQLPKDPGNNQPYSYFQCSDTDYHVGASLEDSSSQSLADDLDQPNAPCGGNGDFATGANNDASACATGDYGSYCYDVQP